MAKIVKTAMRTWDLPRPSGEVPWGISGLGVFIFINWRCSASFLEVLIGFAPQVRSKTWRHISHAFCRCLQAIHFFRVPAPSCPGAFQIHDGLLKHVTPMLVILKLVKTGASG